VAFSSSKTIVVAVACVAVLLLLSACGGKKQSATTTVVATRLETTTAAPTLSVSVAGAYLITIRNGEAVDGPARIDAVLGDNVQLSVRSDAHGTVSVGDIVSFTTVAGGTVSMTFAPDRAGSFPIELDSGQGPKLIGRLVVQE